MWESDLGTLSRDRRRGRVERGRPPKCTEQHTRALLRATNANEQRAQQMFVFPRDRFHKIETGIQQRACLSVRRS